MLEKETWLKGEPSFEDLIADPIVQLVMRRDGLTAEDIWAVTYRARSALQTTPRRAASDYRQIIENANKEYTGT